MFEIGSAEHLEMCLVLEVAHGGFSKTAVAEIQQGMTRAAGIEYAVVKLRYSELYPELHGFLLGYFGTDEFEFPRYQPLGYTGTVKESPRDVTGRFLNIPMKLDA